MIIKSISYRVFVSCDERHRKTDDRHCQTFARAARGYRKRFLCQEFGTSSTSMPTLQWRRVD